MDVRIFKVKIEKKNNNLKKEIPNHLISLLSVVLFKSLILWLKTR